MEGGGVVVVVGGNVNWIISIIYHGDIKELK